MFGVFLHWLGLLYNLRGVPNFVLGQSRSHDRSGVGIHSQMKCEAQLHTGQVLPLGLHLGDVVAFAFFSAQLTDMALPLISTSTSSLPVAFAASVNPSSGFGKSMLVRSPHLNPSGKSGLQFSSLSNSAVIPTAATTMSATRTLASASAIDSPPSCFHSSCAPEVARRGYSSYFTWLLIRPGSLAASQDCHPERTGPQTLFSLGVVSRRICGRFPISCSIVSGPDQ